VVYVPHEHTARSINGRKNSYSAVRHFSQKASILAESAVCPGHVATEEITWSEQLHRIFEFEQDVPVPLDLISTRVHPEDLAMMQDMIEPAGEGAPQLRVRYRLLMPNHSIKYLHLIAHGTRDRAGRLEYIGAVQDVTQRRLSEEALSNARSELAQVARATTSGS
jgi:hypothetical protein